MVGGGLAPAPVAAPRSKTNVKVIWLDPITAYALLRLSRRRVLSHCVTVGIRPLPCCSGRSVVVQDFAVWPGEVQLDPGLSGTIDETLGANQVPRRTAKEQQIGHQVAGALAEELVVEIRDLDLPAERGSGLPPGTTTGLVISGQFVSVDQGNRTERVVLGLGAGRSDVRVRAQVFEVTPSATSLACRRVRSSSVMVAAQGSRAQEYRDSPGPVTAPGQAARCRPPDLPAATRVRAGSMRRKRPVRAHKGLPR